MRAMYLGATLPQPNVFRGRLPSGHEGTRVTLAMMRELVKSSVGMPDIRETALAILRAARVAAHDTVGEVAALFRFVRDRIRFTQDPAGIELLQDARETLRVQAGDCDDRAVLLAALLISIGVCTDLRFRVIAADPRRPRDYTHVYLVARIGGRDVPLDPTYSDSVPGFEPAATLRGEFPLCS